MTDFILAGGPFMWPLLACSVLIITISVERLWFLQERLVTPNGLTNQIVNLFNKTLLIINKVMKLLSCHLLASF